MSAAGYDVVGCDLSPDMIGSVVANAPDATLTLGSAHDVDHPAGGRGHRARRSAELRDRHAGGFRRDRTAWRAECTSALAPGGVFVFDIATHGRGTYERFHRGDGWALGMQSREDGDTLERDISIFARADDGSYQRFDELHVLRLYDTAAVAQLLDATGFAVEVREGYASPAPFAGWSVFVSVRR